MVEKKTPVEKKVEKTVKITPIVSYKLYNITDVMKQEVEALVQKNIKEKMTSSFKKLQTKSTDVDVKIDIKINRNKQSRYEWTVLFSYDGKVLTYKSDKSFKILSDLVNHSFDKFKMRILKK